MSVAAVLALLAIVAACTQQETNGGSGERAVGFPEPVFTPMQPAEVTSSPETWFAASCSLDPTFFERVMRGHYPGRSPDVLWIPRSPNFFGGFVQSGHSGPWDYLQEVPLVFYGPGFIRPLGPLSVGREVTVADIAPTLAQLLGMEFDTDGGKPLDEILVPNHKRPGRPRVIVVVAWDGGGTNVLETWPGFWPELEELMHKGASLRGATVGSSPSVTPATHATMGTGVMPEAHGAVGISFRHEGRLVNSFGGKDADLVEVPMLADVYDPSVGNQAQIGLLAYKSWHLGMMSHGARWPGGDRDMAVFIDVDEELVSNSGVYYKPKYANQIGGLERAIEKVDIRDGKRDDTWLGHDILGDIRYRRDTSAWVLHQTTLIKTLLRREGYGQDEIPDLFFTNYKQIDEAGHNWNMLNQEVAVVLRDTDAQLMELTRFLNRRVGRRSWVMVVTADHGMQPDAQAASAWPINTAEFVSDIAAHFEQQQSGFVEGAPAGIWLDAQVMRSEGIGFGEVADFALGYRISDNIIEGKDVPEEYRSRYDETVLEAAFPGVAAERVRGCISGRE